LQRGTAHRDRPSSDALSLAQNGVGQFVIFVDDVDAVRLELDHAGVTTISGPADRAWGMRTAWYLAGLLAVHSKRWIRHFPPATRCSVKLLLTSAGIKNASIHAALVDLLGKPIAESDALCIPTAGYGHPQGSPGGAWRFIAGKATTPMCELGWRSLGVLELTALPSIDRDRWVRWVRAADVLLVNGGDALYLSHWMRQSGLADLLPSLAESVWVGLSAGSMVMTPRIGADFVGWKPPNGDDSTLGIVDFSIFPHLDHELLPENTMADAEQWAAEIARPAYAIDDDTAIKVTDGTVEIISEGHWKHFNG